MSNNKFVLRVIGTSSFVAYLPYDYDERNLVEGWDRTSEAIVFESKGAALAAKLGDPDGESLSVEEV